MDVLEMQLFFASILISPFTVRVLFTLKIKFTDIKHTCTKTIYSKEKT